ncbi:MAG: phosphatase PAP2 family protein [Clostridia bacterium]|nr:phosphatase PAP2 family protein [Clostridia bacterium]
MKELFKNAPWRRLVWAAWLPIYLSVFFAAEALMPGGEEGYWLSTCAWDSYIPFCEVFVVPYLSWFFLLFGVGVNLWYCHEGPFKRYMILFCVSFFSCAVFWMIVPNIQDLRPETFPRENVFTYAVRFIYGFDTPTNVFPSEHVVGTMAALFALVDSGWMKRHPLGALLFWLWGALIIASTLLIKQHALLDVPSGIAVALFYGVIVYRRRLFSSKSKA